MITSVIPHDLLWIALPKAEWGWRSSTIRFYVTHQALRIPYSRLGKPSTKWRADDVKLVASMWAPNVLYWPEQPAASTLVSIYVLSILTIFALPISVIRSRLDRRPVHHIFHPCPSVNEDRPDVITAVVRLPTPSHGTCDAVSLPSGGDSNWTRSALQPLSRKCKKYERHICIAATEGSPVVQQ
ncbi:hypothetical protein PILCRDRAFT_195884 [Piloderma croceum F 1598]|uniref:Uncharacterized protein n=1 Tax=Piloderma croceum (strain F 1598) TaxID=765440 RepID=A0A0C3GDI9_PILCF|nr:hypothetical protein PILCRDRAFT_195884 [Piloderma croceum F 1598]